MSVVGFERKQGLAAWTEQELDTLFAALNAVLALGNGREWETGTTENGDAQFYLLGPLPDQACEICISRIGGRYILEDGVGRLLIEHQNLELVVLHAKAALGSGHWSLVARAVVLWFTVRHVIHDKVEPLLAESEEVLVHWGPQLVALA